MSSSWSRAAAASSGRVMGPPAPAGRRRRSPAGIPAPGPAPGRRIRSAGPGPARRCPRPARIRCAGILRPAGAGWTCPCWRSLEQDVGTGREGGLDQLKLTPAPDNLYRHVLSARGPRRRARFPRPAGRRSLRCDLVHGAGAGDDLVQLQIVGLVQPEDLRDVLGRIAVAEQAALHALAEQGQDRAGGQNWTFCERHTAHQARSTPAPSRHRYGWFDPSTHVLFVTVRYSRPGRRGS